MDTAETDGIWMQAAWDARACSHDAHHRVGCVCVAADGRHIVSANRIPGRLSRTDPARLESPGKASWLVHAAVMCMCGAARSGINVAGGTLYSTRFPCDDCATILIACGLSEVVSPEPNFSHPRWGALERAADAKLREACILVRRPLVLATPPAGELVCMRGAGQA